MSLFDKDKGYQLLIFVIVVENIYIFALDHFFVWGKSKCYQLFLNNIYYFVVV